jgi:hypothetical protein
MKKFIRIGVDADDERQRACGHLSEFGIIAAKGIGPNAARVGVKVLAQALETSQC